MDFLFESRFNALMEGISGQFGTTPLGLLMFLLALASLPLFLSLLYLLQKHRERQARTRRSGEIIRKRCDRIGLSPAERDLVKKLSDYAGGSESAYLVLFDEPRFNKTAEELQKHETEIGPSSIAALRVKLGFSREPLHRLHSTAQLSPGDPLLVRPQKKQGVFKALITAVRTDGFEIAMDGSNLLTSGDSAVFQYQNRQGSFLFKSYCVKRRGGRMLIRHQEKLKLRQKRAYFRAVYTGKLQVGYFDKDERFPTRFVDIGGGGASLINPEESFDQGDFLELVFSLPGTSEMLNLKGSVIRTSRGRKLLHVKFEGIQENQRDRILGLAFKPR
ncbi:hypothetical protein B4O97_10675 [Marispirochaeta aestuarii]|uniref:PilZ domain-containing protein n=1 Tax=Marispirochaeta aestuarii TaxID=1963862 RepID=A0A1Y1RXT3_9SPIO|nr:PilZ domain-containing protein [Marispirochaeta aestuarii]ORC35180.1 hypothetical protein B4O97_10675 [Marispirochaeta aestuarii]